MRRCLFFSVGKLGSRRSDEEDEEELGADHYRGDAEVEDLAEGRDGVVVHDDAEDDLSDHECGVEPSEVSDETADLQSELPPLFLVFHHQHLF